MKVFGLAIHGGAGNIQKEYMTPELERAYEEKLSEALEVGYKLLASGAPSLNVAEETIKVLEDSPLFNAGKGSVFNHQGKIEMDAAIMNGENLTAGAVAGVKNIKNPITLARKVLDISDHVFLIGEGAEQFAKDNSIDFEDDRYFFDHKRWEQFQKIRDTEATQLDHSQSNVDILENNKFGTVGAVALDQQGNLASGSSTGGVTNKKHGRVGDSPVIGSGLYANHQCAVSSTGHGEYFLRNVVAYDIVKSIELSSLSLKEVCENTINKKLADIGGLGGVIAIDKNGLVAMPFNTPGMYRAFKTSNEEGCVRMYDY